MDRIDTLAALRALARGIDSDTARLRDEVRAAHAGGVPIAQIADAVSVDRKTVYRWISEGESS